LVVVVLAIELRSSSFIVNLRDLDLSGDDLDDGLLIGIISV
jgi:hypothetical protein